MSHYSNKVTLENVNEIIRYHRPSDDQVRRHEELAKASVILIESILKNCPDCADRSSAIRHVRLAKMEASAAIALENH